jgi:hypothetical protein
LAEHLTALLVILVGAVSLTSFTLVLLFIFSETFDDSLDNFLLAYTRKVGKLILV